MFGLPRGSIYDTLFKTFAEGLMQNNRERLQQKKQASRAALGQALRQSTQLQPQGSSGGSEVAVKQLLSALGGGNMPDLVNPSKGMTSGLQSYGQEEQEQSAIGMFGSSTDLQVDQNNKTGQLNRISQNQIGVSSVDLDWLDNLLGGV